ncbi:hypothetical protein KGF54_001729 [Candida jiufengensis]|uniref:uncharacterized protein n=1 Tax=Candida jiufengensis TaxID=497108 RepID=UPI0022251FA2|nr:uncharacterized protein KGF54_001729 [Candida jiufengensis]KAI5955168.1 hypothetical protein KGF54_001729 [Candida jiufengensis]
MESKSIGKSVAQSSPINYKIANSSLENYNSSFSLEATPTKKRIRREFITEPVNIINERMIPRVIPPIDLINDDIIEETSNNGNKNFTINDNILKSSPLISNIQPSKSLKKNLFKSKTVYSNSDDMIKAREVYKNIYSTSSPLTESSKISTNQNKTKDDYLMGFQYYQEQSKRDQVKQDHDQRSSLTPTKKMEILQQPPNDNDNNRNQSALPTPRYRNNNNNNNFNILSNNNFKSETTLDEERIKLMNYYDKHHQNGQFTNYIKKSDILDSFVEHIIVLKVPSKFLKTISIEFNHEFGFIKQEKINGSIIDGDNDDVEIISIKQINQEQQSQTNKQINQNQNQSDKNKTIPQNQINQITEKKLYTSPKKLGCWTCRVRHKKCTRELPKCKDCDKFDLYCDYNESRPEFMINKILQKQKLKEIRNATDLYKQTHQH